MPCCNECPNLYIVYPLKNACFFSSSVHLTSYCTLYIALDVASWLGDFPWFTHSLFWVTMIWTWHEWMKCSTDNQNWAWWIYIYIYDMSYVITELIPDSCWCHKLISTDIQIAFIYLYILWNIIVIHQKINNTISDSLTIYILHSEFTWKLESYNWLYKCSE